MHITAVVAEPSFSVISETPTDAAKVARRATAALAWKVACSGVTGRRVHSFTAADGLAASAEALAPPAPWLRWLRGSAVSERSVGIVA